MCLAKGQETDIHGLSQCRPRPLPLLRWLAASHAPEVGAPFSPPDARRDSHFGSYERGSGSAIVGRSGDDFQLPTPSNSVDLTTRRSLGGGNSHFLRMTRGYSDRLSETRSVVDSKPRSAAATTGVILGVFALLLALVPFFGVLGLLPAFVALGLGLWARAGGGAARRRALWAVWMGGVSAVLSLAQSIAVPG